MDNIEQQPEDDVMEMEVPEIDGDLLVELLDASLTGAEESEEEEAAGRQLGFTADLGDGDGGGWVDGQELNYSIHPHQDCVLDGILSDFEGCGCSRSPAPYVLLDADDPVEWAETAEAALGPFTGECMGEWYMDGMAMEWDEEDGGSGFSFEPCYGGEAGAEHVYGSPSELVN